MKTRTLRFFFGVIVLLICNPGQALAQPLFSPTQDPLSGSRIFGNKGCSRCHAVFGVGGRIAPDLGRIPRPRSFYDLATAMWNHLPQMSEQMGKLGIAIPRLSPSETGDLIAFLYTVDYFDRPGDSQAGREFFMKKHCVSCHQVGGTGGVVGPSFDSLAQYNSPIFFATAMWNHGPAMAEAMRARGIKRPTFDQVELRDLIAYIDSASPKRGKEPLYILPGRPDQGQRLFVRKQCVECHSVKGRGGRVGGDLAKKGVRLNMLQFAVAMWNKSPAMIKEMKKKNIPLPRLQAEEMADIIAYLYSVRYFATPGDPRRGQKLAASKGCLGCHSVAGKGGKVGPDFERIRELDQPVTVVSAMWNHASAMKEKMREESISWPLFKEREMGDIIAYLQSLGRAR